MKRKTKQVCLFVWSCTNYFGQPYVSFFCQYFLFEGITQISEHLILSRGFNDPKLSCHTRTFFTSRRRVIQIYELDLMKLMPGPWGVYPLVSLAALAADSSAALIATQTCYKRPFD